MRQKSILALVGVFALVVTPLTAVVADKLFHTVNLLLVLTIDGAVNGHSPLRSGHVIDIHPNGPVHLAHERYLLNGAKPNTAYDVVLRVNDGSCAGPVSAFDMLKTVTLITDKQGNAHGKADFPASTPLPTPRPIFFGIRWTLVAGGVVAYETDCITVGVD